MSQGDARSGTDGTTKKTDGAVTSGDGAPTAGKCKAAGGRCDCSCGGDFPVQADQALNDCPQPCAECGACSQFCCLPDPECDATAGCVKVCEGGPCQCECPPTKTPCGDASCDRKTEVCVGKGPVGPAVLHSCEPVPAGCETDRTCGCLAARLCNAGDTCGGAGAKDNEIFCDNGTQ